MSEDSNGDREQLRQLAEVNIQRRDQFLAQSESLDRHQPQVSTSESSTKATCFFLFGFSCQREKLCFSAGELVPW